MVLEEAGGKDVGIFFSFSFSFTSVSLGFSSFSFGFFELPAVSLLLGVFGPEHTQKVITSYHKSVK